MLTALKDFNKGITGFKQDSVEVVSYIEELEDGSIKTWIRDVLVKIDDKKIEEFAEKPREKQQKDIRMIIK